MRTTTLTEEGSSIRGVMVANHDGLARPHQGNAMADSDYSIHGISAQVNEDLGRRVKWFLKLCQAGLEFV